MPCCVQVKMSRAIVNNLLLDLLTVPDTCILPRAALSGRYRRDW